MPYQPSVTLCINSSDPQHPHVQAGGNKFCTTCGAAIALRDRYIPLKKLGTGGFSVIYTIWDLQTQTERVLKILLENSAKARQLFQQEAAILTSLNHPGVPRVEPDGYFHLPASNSKRDLFCLVMEKIDGQTLEAILDKYDRGCPEEMVRDWFGQALEILQVLHSRQIIHRDLKPSNLMLRQETNRLVLIDFGGAKKRRSRQHSVSAAESSTRLYSPGYSPPEQSSGRDVEPAADFYALGRTTIELLTGQPPSELEDPVTKELSWRHLVQVSPAFADLLDELVQEDARLRPTSATAIEQRLLQSPPTETQPSVYQAIHQLSLNGWKRSQLIATYLTHRLAQISKQRSPQLVNQMHQIAARTTNLLAETIRKQSPPSTFQTHNTAPQRSHTLRQATQRRLLTSHFASIPFVTKTGRSLTNITRSLWRLITQVGHSGIDTIRAIVWSAIAAVVGTSIGFIFGYFSPLGIAVNSFLVEYLPQLMTESQIATEAESIVFASAGLFTAAGLTALGVFDQRRHYLMSALLGASGYVLGWLCWTLITPYIGIWSLPATVCVAIAFLVSGLGLRRHRFFHATVAAVSTAIVFTILIRLNLFPALIFHLSPQPSWFELQLYATFFGAIAAISSCCLGISHYILIPCWRWLQR
ncbi:hypothetical protein B7486_48025 [cyanobacterium TDX16]|nr:hypothetical protein B7486_48025 [cyanobacterium TDX16]